MLLAAAPGVQDGADLGPCVGCVAGPLQRLEGPRGLPSAVAQRKLLQKVQAMFARVPCFPKHASSSRHFTGSICPAAEKSHHPHQQ